MTPQKVVSLHFDQFDQGSGTTNQISMVTPKSAPIQSRVINFKFSEKVSEPLVLDGALLGIFFDAMSLGLPVKVDGTVSLKLLRNLRHLGEAWVNMAPKKYSHPLEITATKILPMPGPQIKVPEKHIQAYSGGLDASFTLLRNTAQVRNPSRFEIKDALVVHGFDIRQDNKEGFDRLLKKVLPSLEAYGVQPHFVWTDIRKSEQVSWGHSFGAKLASVFHQLSGEFTHGLIGSSEPYRHPSVAWGSAPNLDFLLSGGLFDIVHDGAGFSRTEKAKIVSSSRVLTRNLNVCWAGEPQGENCGACEKCIRTRLNFLAVGVPKPSCFFGELKLEQVRSLAVSEIPQLIELETVLEYWRERKTSRPIWYLELQQTTERLRSELVR